MNSKQLCAAIIMVAASVSLSARENEPNRTPEIINPHANAFVAPLSERTTGFWAAVEAGIGSSVISGKNVGFAEVDVTAGYRFSEFLRIGPGFGYRQYFPTHTLRQKDGSWSMPLYFNVRGNMMTAQYHICIPYYSFDIGGAFQDGFMWRPTIGLKIGEPRRAFTIGLSYVGQSIRTYSYVDRGENPELIKGSRYVSMLCLRLGFEY